MCGGAEVQDKPLNVCVLCVYLWVCVCVRERLSGFCQGCSISPTHPIPDMKLLLAKAAEHCAATRGALQHTEPVQPYIEKALCWNSKRIWYRVFHYD